MRSLTRSMGAAAVFETAAETPPTDKGLAAATGAEKWPIILASQSKANSH